MCYVLILLLIGWLPLLCMTATPRTHVANDQAMVNFETFFKSISRASANVPTPEQLGYFLRRSGSIQLEEAEVNEKKVVDALKTIDSTLLNSRDKQGYSLLTLSCKRGYSTIVTYLTEEMKHRNVMELINTKINGYAALHISVACGHIGIMRHLLEQGADPTLKTDDQETARSIAKSHLETPASRQMHDLLMIYEKAWLSKTTPTQTTARSAIDHAQVP